MEKIEWRTDDTFGTHYLGSVPCNGGDIYFMILKDRDDIIIDSDTVVRAAGNMTDVLLSRKFGRQT